MSINKFNENEQPANTNVIDSVVNTGNLDNFPNKFDASAKNETNALKDQNSKEMKPEQIKDPEQAKQFEKIRKIVDVKARHDFLMKNGIPGKQAWEAIVQTLPGIGNINYYQIDEEIKTNPQLMAIYNNLYAPTLRKVQTDGILQQLLVTLKNKNQQNRVVTQFNLKNYKVSQKTSRFPVSNMGEFIEKFLPDIMAWTGTGEEGDFLSNKAIEEIQETCGGFEQEANSALKQVRDLSSFNKNKAEEIMRVIYENWLPTSVKDKNTGITTMSESNPKGIIKFNLSNHVLNNKGEVVKQASSGLGNEYLLYGPTEKRICPKLRGKFGGSGTGNDVVSEYICRHHCLDGIVIDDNKTICGEALWRANVMDKFSREYVDENGNTVGGYINGRFEVNRNVPEETKMRLKPGEVRKPRPANIYGNMEARLQDMRNKEGEKRNYKPNTDTSKPFNWTKDVDQNNVEISQTEREKREKDAGHEIISHPIKQIENNPKVVEAGTFNLNSFKTAKKQKGTTYKGEHYDTNPWAVCHTTVDKDEDPEKYERCVKEVKENSKTSSSNDEIKISENTTSQNPTEDVFSIDEFEAFPNQMVIDKLGEWKLDPEGNADFSPSYKLWARWSRGVAAEPQLVSETVKELEEILNDSNISFQEDDQESLIDLIRNLLPYTKQDKKQEAPNVAEHVPNIAEPTETDTVRTPVVANKFNLKNYKLASDEKKK